MMPFVILYYLVQRDRRRADLLTSYSLISIWTSNANFGSHDTLLRLLGINQVHLLGLGLD